jgi:phosphate-selective porin OprO and OprP
MRNNLALTSGAAIGAVLALTLSAGTARAQDTTTTWKGAPQFQNDTLTFKVRGRAYLDYVDFHADPSTGSSFDAQVTRSRTVRLGVEGTWNANWAYKAEAQFQRGTAEWEDLILEYKLNDYTSLMIGNYKAASFENISSSRYITFMERGPFNDVLGIGRVMTAQAKVNGENWTAAGFVHGDSINSADPAVTTTGATSEQFAYGVRGTWAPINGDTAKLHLGAWARKRDRGQGSGTAAQPTGFSYAMRNNTNYGPQFLTTGAIGDRDTQIAGEFLYLMKNFSVQGEYANVDIKRTNGTSDDIKTYYVAASWFVTGEMRNLDVKKGELGRTKILNPMTSGGPGAFELAARYDNTDLSGVSGVATAGEYKAWTLGANWYPHPYTRVMANYTKSENDLPGAGVDVDADTFQMRFQFDF